MSELYLLALQTVTSTLLASVHDLLAACLEKEQKKVPAEAANVRKAFINFVAVARPTRDFLNQIMISDVAPPDHKPIAAALSSIINGANLSLGCLSYGDEDPRFLIFAMWTDLIAMTLFRIMSLNELENEK